MSDISVSERRLSAALDRIDQLLEAGTGRPTASDPSPDTAELQKQLEVLEAENARLAAELAALQTDQGGPVEASLAEARTRLAGAGDQAARLAAANEELAAANRGLIDAASGQGAPADAALAALDAEVESLRAARAAEIAQMGDIMMELERFLGQDGSVTAAQMAGDDAVLSEVTGDSAGVPEHDQPDGSQGHDRASADADSRDGDR